MMKKIPSVKSSVAYQEVPLKLLEIISKLIAFVVCFGLLITSILIIINSFIALNNDLHLAVQDGLFVLILLEMFYVIRSFIRYGSINVSLIVNVGIIAAIKEMIFQLDKLNVQLGIAFGTIFVTLGFLYFMEQFYYRKMVKDS